MVKKRSAILTVILSLLLPGLGHIYIGDVRRGIYLILFKYGLMLALGFFGVFSTFYGVIFLIVFLCALYIFALYDSVKQALGKKDYQLNWYNRWYIYLAVLFITTLPYVFSSKGEMFGFEIYSIPANSMSPVLQKGDYITVNTRFDSLNVGDVVVFTMVGNEEIKYTKRVAALANDKISIRNGMVLRNGIPEKLLYVLPDKRLRDYSITMKERKIPEGEVFLLGDWRDNSNDSRFYGSVPVTNIIGKVTYIFFSKKVNRIGRSVEK